MWELTYGNKYIKNKEITNNDHLSLSDLKSVTLDFLEANENEYDVLPSDWFDTIFINVELEKENENMERKIEIQKLARNVQDAFVEFILDVNYSGIGCMSREIKVDGYMVIFNDEKTWKKFVDVFDILGMDFTTGEPDGNLNNWYIDFEFSNGISD